MCPFTDPFCLPGSRAIEIILEIANFPFYDAWMRISRARTHFEELRNEIGVYMLPPKPYLIRDDYDPQSGKHIVSAVIEREAMPIFSLIAGDMVHSLRSALDYAIWEMVSGKGWMEDWKIKFPVSATDSEFKKEPVVDVLRNRYPKAFALIEGLQTFSAVTTDDADLLWGLHRLDIEDKHHRLHVVAAAVDPRYTYISLYGSVIRVGEDWFDRREIICLENGTPLFSYTLSEPKPDVCVEADLDCRIAFRHSSAADCKPVDTFLDSLLILTQGILDQLTEAVK